MLVFTSKQSRKELLIDLGARGVTYVKIAMLIAALIIVFFVCSLLTKKQKAKNKKPNLRILIIPPREQSKRPIAPPAEQSKCPALPESHRKHRDKPYQILCNEEVFSDDEFDTLEEYGSWLSALMLEEIKPETDSQREFINLCKNYQNLPLREMFNTLKSSKLNINSIQFVWFKYLCRIKYEIENPKHIKSQKVMSARNNLLNPERTHDV